MSVAADDDCHRCFTERTDALPSDAPWHERALQRMILCPTCGNKRCPKANDHRHTCTHSNEPGQPGSAYPALPLPSPDRDVYDIDLLPATSYLVMEVLGARWRCGEVAWTFPSRIRPALRHLEGEGLIAYKAGSHPKTCLAWLTDAGKDAMLTGNYTQPVAPLPVVPSGSEPTMWGICACPCPCRADGLAGAICQTCLAGTHLADDGLRTTYGTGS